MAGLLNIGVAVIIFLVVRFLATGVISLVTGQPTAQADTMFLELLTKLVPLFYVIAGGLWFRANRRSGAVLFDCGPNPQRYLLRTIAGVALVLFIAPDVLFWTLEYVDWNDLNQAVILLYLVAISFGRAQIRQNGLWLYASFIPWEKVISYEVDLYSSPRDPRIWVVVQTGGVFNLRQEVSLPVPTTRKQALLDLLDQYSSFVERDTLIRPTD